MAQSLTDLVPVPPDAAINTGMTPCPTHEIERRYVRPRQKLTAECQPATSAAWKARFVTEDVGPFRVTGHRLAVKLLRESLAAVKAENPALYAALGTAGMLCIRCVKLPSGPRPDLMSNHSLGLAIDFTINGKLDRQGDGKCFVGSLQLYSILKRFGWYWGAEFSTEDGMHWDVSGEKVMEWIRAGIF